jgi:hypothetical protein
LQGHQGRVFPTRARWHQAACCRIKDEFDAIFEYGMLAHGFL